MRRKRRDGEIAHRNRAAPVPRDLRLTPVKLLEVDPAISGRLDPVDPKLVKQISRAIRLGVPVDRLVVCVVGPPRDRRWIVIDGRARLAAAIEAGETEAICEVYQGTAGDALWAAAGANRTNGTPRSLKERRRCVELAITADPLATDLEIAIHTGTTPGAVARMRSKMSREAKKSRPEPLPPAGRVE